MRLIFALVFFFNSAASAMCIPTNPMHLPPMAPAAQSGLNQSEFHQTLDAFYTYWAPIIQASGFELVFERKWDSGEVNASTILRGTKRIINAYGGLARYQGMTEDGYTLVMCHELGHHLGSVKFYKGDWASVEGESDYWAAKNCMKDMGYNEQEIRDASQVLGNTLASLRGQPNPNPETRDTTIVKRTDTSHPDAQCRLDTYLDGLVCPERGPLDFNDPKVNSCYEYPDATSAGVGSRSRCWFKPADDLLVDQTELILPLPLN